MYHNELYTELGFHSTFIPSEARLYLGDFVIIVNQHWTKLHSFTFPPVLYRRERVWGTLFLPLYIYWEQTVWAHSFPPINIQERKSMAYTFSPLYYTGGKSVAYTLSLCM